MLESLAAVPGTPRLEEHYHFPIEARHRRGLDKGILALQVDARLVHRARLEGRLERARAAVARRLLDRRVWEAAGFSNPRDYAREECGLSLRALQDLARLDRGLSAFPRLDEAVTAGRVAPSRALLVLPVVTPETEGLWLREAERNTCARLAEIVRVAREMGWGAGGGQTARESNGAPIESSATDPEAVVSMRMPARSQKLWEAFVEEASRAAGRPLSQGEAIETLVAEFWPLVPPEVAASVRERAERASQGAGAGGGGGGGTGGTGGAGGAAAGVATPLPTRTMRIGGVRVIVIAGEDDDEEWVADVDGADYLREHRRRESDGGWSSGSTGVGGDASMGSDFAESNSAVGDEVPSGGAAATVRAESTITGPGSPILCTRTAAPAGPRATVAPTGAASPRLHPDMPSFQILRPRGEWRRELIRKLERDPERPAFLQALDRRVADYAADLLARGLDLAPEDEALLQTSDLDRLAPRELQRRYLALRARLRRLAVDQGALLLLMRNFQLYRALKYAGFGQYTRDRCGLGRRAADERADRHRSLIWDPALRRAWMRDEISDSHLQGFYRLRRNGLSGGDLRPWIARARIVTVETFLDQVRWIEAARSGWCRNGHRNFAANRPNPPSPRRPPSYAEWIRIRAEWNRAPDLLASIAGGWQISARGGLEPPPPGPFESEVGDSEVGIVDRVVGDSEGSASRQADARVASPFGLSSVPNPLVPSLSEPATHTQRLFAPLGVARELALALDAVRAIHGPALPDWWCLEVMMLHVRRDWARESDWARSRTEHYEIFARDGFRCTAPGCRSRRNLQAHHIAFRSRGGSDDPSNLTTLCAACHQFALHRAQVLHVRGRAPHRLVWEMGQETGPDGRERPWRRFVGEFRRERPRR